MRGYQLVQGSSRSTTSRSRLDSQCRQILEARHHEPFSVLGRHRRADGEVLRALVPRAAFVRLGEDGPWLDRVEGSDLFQYHLVEGENLPAHYSLTWEDGMGNRTTFIDPYTFAPQIPDFDLHLFGEGRHWHIHRLLGARTWVVDGVEGVLFATWAPNASRVSVVGDFNHWDGRCHPMRVRGGSGVWELFIPGMTAGTLYKFELRSQDGAILLKADPYGRQFELRPATAALVPTPDIYRWQDAAWLEARSRWDWLHQPASIYELHLGSWQRDEHGHFLNYRDLAHQLVEYLQPLGFTHIELLPITEHPLDASWGYQTTGYFAPTSRHGTPDDFRYFVDHCHQHGIGIILDWVPAHFPKDAHGLARFDGSALYEHEDPRRGEHRDWGTLIYNYGRNEVKNFLLASALFWLEEFHLDGLRVDAVASMLYLDYSRNAGDWVPNVYGGNENLEAIAFLRELNAVAHDRHPGALVIAEESTAWPQVTRPTHSGGLGFSMKWNMGWMHDTLVYFSKEPVHRCHHHEQLTFGLLYAFTENFVLPFSHDEIVHGKRSMLGKMPGDEWQRFANLRLLYTYQFTYPGKKLLFMGSEFGQGDEWNESHALDWYVLDYPLHQGVKALVGDLNRLYRTTPALFRDDFEQQGFGWIDCNDAQHSIISYLRRDGGQFRLVVLNFTPVPRQEYRVGVPQPGAYQELLNSDSEFYGGSNLGNGWVEAEAVPWMGLPWSVRLTLPPLAGIILAPTGD
ncbi:MAG: 1,4-alpha-glucan branching protein GlgB [Methylococcaceae bacterium]|nr:MAG: 1,4-alpha-glucan branching protein GlgB [Methylococcaceae bacterium]